ncbi:MAG: hypothetical protein ABFQ65_02845 [Nanoarchaeota archaeon]
MKDEQFEVICKKLDKIALVLSMQNIKDQDKKISMLKKAGFDSSEIGELLGLSNVRTTSGWKGGKNGRRK